eukprot:16443138-Heterocapsa_arctica.AAC.1
MTSHEWLDGAIYAELPQIWPVSGVRKDQHALLKVAWYRPNDGPLEFHRTLDEYTLSLYPSRRKLDPCLCRRLDRSVKFKEMDRSCKYT